MIEKRFKVAVYDENAINGFAVLDLHKPNISKRLKYENVYIGSKVGCEIVCNFGNGLADENNQLKQREKTLEGMIRTFDEGCKEIYDDKCRLEKENEQLKKELKRCKDWINSDKYDYELTLSFIKSRGYSLKDVLEYEKELNMK